MESLGKLGWITRNKKQSCEKNEKREKKRERVGERERERNAKQKVHGKRLFSHMHHAPQRKLKWPRFARCEKRAAQRDMDKKL